MQDRWITPWRYLFLFIFKGLQLGRIHPFPPVKYLCDFNSHLTIKKAGRSTLYNTAVLYAYTNIHTRAFMEPQVVQGLNSFREATLWNSSSGENWKAKLASAVGDFQFINPVGHWKTTFSDFWETDKLERLVVICEPLLTPDCVLLKTGVIMTTGWTTLFVKNI